MTYLLNLFTYEREVKSSKRSRWYHHLFNYQQQQQETVTHDYHCDLTTFMTKLIRALQRYQRLDLTQPDDNGEFYSILFCSILFSSFFLSSSTNTCFHTHSFNFPSFNHSQHSFMHSFIHSFLFSHDDPFICLCCCLLGSIPFILFMKNYPLFLFKEAEFLSILFPPKSSLPLIQDYNPFLVIDPHTGSNVLYLFIEQFNEAVFGERQILHSRIDRAGKVGMEERMENELKFKKNRFIHQHDLLVAKVMSKLGERKEFSVNLDMFQLNKKGKAYSP